MVGVRATAGAYFVANHGSFASADERTTVGKRSASSPTATLVMSCASAAEALAERRVRHITLTATGPGGSAGRLWLVPAILARVRSEGQVVKLRPSGRSQTSCWSCGKWRRHRPSGHQQKSALKAKSTEGRVLRQALRRVIDGLAATLRGGSGPGPQIQPALIPKWVRNSSICGPLPADVARQ